MKEKNISGSVRQLSVGILVEDLSGTALVCNKDKNMGIESEGVESLVLKRKILL